MRRMPAVSTSFIEGNTKDGIKMKWKIILWVCLPWHLRQSVLFSPHLLNFGSYSNGIHTNWDNLKWRCFRNHSCDDCRGMRRPQLGSRGYPMQTVQTSSLLQGLGWVRLVQAGVSLNFSRNLALVGGLCHLTCCLRNLTERVCKPQKDWTDQRSWDDFHLFSPSMTSPYQGKELVCLGKRRTGKQIGGEKWQEGKCWESKKNFSLMFRSGKLVKIWPKWICLLSMYQ